MIVVKVELWSAISGEKTELARMEICNDETGDMRWRNYITQTLRGRTTADLNRRQQQRAGTLKNWPSETVHIWNLVAVVLGKLGYGAPRGWTE